MDKIKIIHREKMSFDAYINDKITPIHLNSSQNCSENCNEFTPKPLILVAFGGCTAMDIASLVRKMRIDIVTFDVTITADLREEKPNIYTKFYVHYDFTIDHLPSMTTKEKLKKIVEMSQERYCPLSAMLRKVAPIKYTVTINGSAIETCACKRV